MLAPFTTSAYLVVEEEEEEVLQAGGAVALKLVRGSYRTLGD